MTAKPGATGASAASDDLGVVDALGLHAEVQRQRPGDVVVGLVDGVGREHLRGQEIDGVVPVGLVEAHDVRPGGELPFRDLERRGRPSDLDALGDEQPDHLGDALAVALVLGDGEGERLALDALLPGIVALAVEVAEHLLGVLGRVVEGGQAAALHVIGVVAERPHELARRRHGPVPLLARHGPPDVALLLRAEDPLDGLGRAAAEGLVAAADAVVVDADRVEEDVLPAVAEAPRPDAGHAGRREGADLGQRHGEPLAEQDRIEVGVEGPRAVPGLQERDGFVEVVDDRRVVVEEHPGHGLRGLKGHLVRVAVVVVEDVMAPVGRRFRRQAVIVGLALEIAIEPVDLLVAAVGLGDGVDEDEDVPADPLDHRLIGHGQAVGQLHDHLGRAELRRMEGGVEVENGPARSDQSFGGVGRRFARVGQGGGRGLEPVEVADPGLVGDGHQQDVPPLFALADRLDADAGRGLGQLAEVAVDPGRRRELAGGADDVAEIFGGRRHRVRVGQVGHPGIAEAGLGRELGDGLDRSRLDLVRGVRVLDGRGRGLGRLGRGREEDKEQRKDRQGSFHGLPPVRLGRCLRLANSARRGQTSTFPFLFSAKFTRISYGIDAYERHRRKTGKVEV